MLLQTKYIEIIIINISSENVLLNFKYNIRNILVLIASLFWSYHSHGNLWVFSASLFQGNTYSAILCLEDPISFGTEKFHHDSRSQSCLSS